MGNYSPGSLKDLPSTEEDQAVAIYSRTKVNLFAINSQEKIGKRCSLPSNYKHYFVFLITSQSINSNPPKSNLVVSESASKNLEEEKLILQINSNK